MFLWCVDHARSLFETAAKACASVRDSDRISNRNFDLDQEANPVIQDVDEEHDVDRHRFLAPDHESDFVARMDVDWDGDPEKDHALG